MTDPGFPQKTVRPTKAPLDKEIQRLEKSRVSRYAWLVLLIKVLPSTVPSAVLLICSQGVRIVRFGYSVPLVVTGLVVLGEYALTSPIFHATAPTVRVLAMFLAGLGVWSIVGIIAAIYSLPIAESALDKLSRMIEGQWGKTTLTIEDLSTVAILVIGAMIGCDASAKAIADNLSEKHELEAVIRLRMLAIGEIFSSIRMDMAELRQKLCVELLITRFGIVFWIFVVTIFSFALLYHSTGIIDKTAFEPAEATGFWDYAYYSFLTMTTVGAETKANAPLIKVCSVTEVVLGIAFLTIVISATVAMFQGAGKDGLLPLTKEESKAFRKKLFGFLKTLPIESANIRASLNRIVDLCIQQRKLGVELAKQSKDVLDQLPQSDRGKTLGEIYASRTGQPIK